MKVWESYFPLSLARTARYTMCYDISFTVKLKELPAYFPDLETNLQLELDFDGTHIMGHSFNDHPILYLDRETKKISIRPMQWGVIPFYVKDENSFLRQRVSMLNTRSERILGDEKSYWYKIRNRRCLIPVTGVYEHRAIEGWKKKVPYFIHLKKQPLFFLPGLYSVADLPDQQTGEMIKRYTFSLITRNGNDLMKKIHNDGDNRGRMPLFLPLELSKEFLDEDLSQERYQEILQFEMPEDQMEAITVYTIRSAKPRPDGKAKNEYWEWEKLPA
jgi:putative SOS response-associated peptidase YedK